MMSKSQLKKKLLVALTPMIFVLFTGCGGSDAPPPQSQASKDNEAGRREMMAAAQQMKQSCSSTFTPYIAQQATMVMNPQMAPMAGQQPAPDGGSCPNDIMNFMMSWKTYYGAEANGADPQSYVINQFRGAFNHVEQGLRAQGIIITPQLLARMAVSGSVVPAGLSFLGRLNGSGLPPATASFFQGQGSAALNSLASYR